MKKNDKLLLFTIGVTIIGWLLMGIGYTIKLGHPINTICFLLGFALIIVGIVFFIKIIKEK
jgi:NhaP-type Na+/H+ or K+/H+ antiporter